MSVVVPVGVLRALRGVVAALLAATVLAVYPAAPVAAQTVISDCSNPFIVAAQLDDGGHFILTGNCTSATLDLSFFPILINNGVSTQVEGNGVTFLNTNFRVFVVEETGSLSLDGVTITGGGTGGGIDNDGTLTVTNSTFIDNYVEASSGAAIDNSGISESASATIIGSTFRNNTSAGFGGAIGNGGSFDGGVATMTISDSTFIGNEANYGGAIENNGFQDGSATMTISGSTFSGNHARSGGGAILSSSSADDEGSSVDLTITNSTFSGNTATAGSVISSFADDEGSTATLTISSSTFSDNDGSTGPGSLAGVISTGTVFGATATTTLTSTIFATSSPRHCYTSDGTVTSNGYNLADANDASCFDGTVTGDQLVTDALLGPLQDNGGPTHTHRPGLGSPAIDQGNCPTLSTDQRGLPRIVDQPPANAADGCDVGAVEFQDFAIEFFTLRGGSSALAPYPGFARRQAGDPVYLRFSLDVDISIDDLTGVQVQPISCASGAPIGSAATAQLVNGVRYYEGAGYYQLIWRTQASWAGSCKQLVLTFSDGSAVRFNVQFTANR